MVRSPSIRRSCLIAGLAAAVLSCETGSVPQGRLVRASVVRCRPVDQLLEERIRYWREEVSRLASTAIVDPTWESRLPELLEEHQGVLVDVQIEAEARIDGDRSFGEPGALRVRPWRAASERSPAFVSYKGDHCSTYEGSGSTYFLETDMGRDRYPPRHLADFLGVPVLLPVSGIFYEFLPEDFRLARHRDPVSAN